MAVSPSGRIRRIRSAACSVLVLLPIYETYVLVRRQLGQSKTSTVSGTIDTSQLWRKIRLRRGWEDYFGLL